MLVSCKSMGRHGLKEVLMSITIIKGTIISAPALGELDITENGYLVAEDGKITGIFPTLPEQYAGAPAEDYGSALILQSLADLHLHGPSTAVWPGS